MNISSSRPERTPSLLARLAGRESAPSEIRLSKRQSFEAEIRQLAAFGRISANLLHEITNPLTVALLNLERSDPRITEAKRSLQQMQRYIQAARQQLQQQSAITSFSVQSQVIQLLRIIRPLAQQAGVRLTVDHIGKHQIIGEPIKFQQLLANLIMNAVQAYDGYEVNDKKVQLTIRRNDEWLVLIVTDFGRGITPAQLPKLFEPFYTTKAREGAGLGLGLALVKQIVENDFHGSISATSSPYSGTQFIVKLKAFETE